MSLSIILKKRSIPPAKKCSAMQPYIAVTDGYTKGGKNFIYQVPIPDSDWTLIGVASLEGLQMLQSQLLYSFIGLGLLALIMCLIGIGFVLRLWIKPLRDLQTIILRIGAGDAHVRAVAKGSPELVDLAQAFNAMLDQIDHLMQQVKEEEQNARRYELRALSAQINPHFLYNTLDTIVWMAEFNDSRRVVNITKSLAQYFRLALNQGQEQILLRDEIDHVRQYLFIQKQRYGEKLNYEILEDERLGDYQLPKLVLQPLVENAIYHGIKEIDRPGLIRVTTEVSGDSACVSIFDNGRGFDRSESTDQPLLRLGGVGLKMWTNDCIFNLAKPIIWRLILRPIAIRKSLFICPFHPAMNIHRGWDKSPSLSIILIVDQKQWTDVGSTAPLHQLLQPYSTVREVGRRNRIPNELPISVLLLLSNMNFNSFLVKSARHQIYDKIKCYSK